MKMVYTRSDILEKAENFDVQKYKTIESRLESVRKDFVKDYPISRIPLLTREEYACGFKILGNTEYRTFCYRIENDLKELGNIKGRSANKFGIYLSQKSEKYQYTQKFGSTEDEAFANVKAAIVSLLHAAEDEDLRSIEKSSLANLFKYKLIATYYPDRYLPIFSEEHLNEFLTKLGIEIGEKDSFIIKQDKLIAYKDSVPCMSDWSLYIFMCFLYSDDIGIDSQQKKHAEERQKQDDEAYPANCKSGISISEKQWKAMLLMNNIFTSSDIDLLCQIYREPNHAVTCKELAVQNGVSSTSYISPVVHLAKRVLKHLNVSPEKRSDGRNRYWNVLFWGRDLPGGLFEWKLRPSLAAALLSLYPDIGSDEINEALDNSLARDVSITPIRNEKTIEINRSKPESAIIRGVQAYPRNRAVALYALEKAGHRCEINAGHETFMRKADGLPYTEPHHLIPMAAQDRFDVSLDVPENIVSLCSNCHNEIHYGKDARDLITQLFEMRHTMLESAGISITLQEVLALYGIK